MTGKRNSLEKLTDVVDIIQKSSSEVALQMAGLRFITKILEDEPGQERQVIKVDSGPSVRSVPFPPQAIAVRGPLSVPLLCRRRCLGGKIRTGS